MSPAKQIAVVVAAVAILGGGWLAYERGWFGANQDTASAAQPPGGGQTGGQGRSQGGRSGPGGGGMAVPVVTAAVELDNSGLDVHAVGTVAATRAVTLFPEAAGVVQEVLFKPGTQVDAGAPLVRLADSEQQVAVDRARIALDSARVSAERAERLAQSNNITDAALADARTAVQQAEVDLRGAELELAKRTLVAPFAGTIGLTDVTVGDLVSSSKEIATLDDMSTVTVSFEVPERVSGRVTVGQELEATTAALAGSRFTGHVSAINSRVDPVARTLRVEASLPNEANVLKPGMALNVSLSFPGQEQPAVPSLAVQWDRNGPYVWRSEGETVARVGVDIVGRRSGIVIVAAGELAPGDHVVVEGLQRLREGARINPIREEGGPDDAAPDQGVPSAEAGPDTARRAPSG